MPDSKLTVSFPNPRRLSTEEMKIRIFRERRLEEVKAIALELVLQMDDATQVRCEHCGRLVHGDNSHHAGRSPAV